MVLSIKIGKHAGLRMDGSWGVRRNPWSRTAKSVKWDKFCVVMRVIASVVITWVHIFMQNAVQMSEKFLVNVLEPSGTQGVRV